MRLIDLDNELAHVSLAAGREGTTNDGDGVDISKYKGNLKVIANYDAGEGTDPTLDIKLQDSDDDITYADITDKAFAQIIDAASLQSLSLDTRAIRQFVRAEKTVGGTDTPTFDGSVVFIGQDH